MKKEENIESNNTAPIGPNYIDPNGKKKKPIFKKWWFWLIVVIVIICIIVAATGGSEDEDEPESEEVYSEETAEETETESEVETETETTTEAVDTTNIVYVLSLFGTFDPVTITGSGDDVIEMPVTETPVLLEITYSGSSNFVVHTVDSSGDNVDLLVNTIGSYSGTLTDYLDYSDVAMLSIESSGDWSVTIMPMDSMSELVSGTEYTGDGVYYISTDSLMTISLTNSGESNFIVRGIGMDDSGLLVNEIGDYSGTVVWAQPQSFLIIESEGTWTVSW